MKKLYLKNPRTRAFSAKITSIVKEHDMYAIALDKTYFFPSGGGQLADKGTINRINIIDYITIDKDVFYALEQPLNTSIGEHVSCEINFDWRFELMQQHTGQHILSHSILKTTGLETLSFQMKDDISQIQIPFTSDLEGLCSSEIHANQIVFDCVSVETISICPSKSEEYNLRKQPLSKHLDKNGEIRIAKIGGFESIPCGGTHCSNTGEVGLIKIINSKKQSKKLIIDFVCGFRAYRNYHNKIHTLDNISTLLTANKNTITSTVQNILEELSKQKRQNNQRTSELLNYKAKDLLAKHEEIGEVKLVIKGLPELDISELNILGNKIVEGDNFICVLHNEDGFLLKQSENSSQDISLIYNECKNEFDIKGGVTRNSIQGKIFSKTMLQDFILKITDLIRGEYGKSTSNTNRKQ